MLCLFGMVALPYWSTGESARLRELVRDATAPMQITLERLHREALGMANDLQGFLLTGEASYLRTFETQVPSVRAAFDRARQLAGREGLRDSPALLREIADAESSFSEWLARSRASVTSIQPRASDAAPLEVRSGPRLWQLQSFSTHVRAAGELVRIREDRLRDRLEGFQRIERLLVLVLGTLAGMVVVYLTWLGGALLRVQRQALNERDQLEAVLASVDSGVLLLDREMRVAVANERAGQLLAIPLARLTGVDGRRLAMEELKGRVADPEAYAKRLHYLYDNPDAVSEDIVEVVRPESRTLSRYTAPVRDEVGLTLGRIEVYRDVTDVLRRERELAEANRRKDEFVATLSHELRTPLTPILGWIELLRGEDDPGRIAQGLAAIHRNVRLQSQLVEDLLDLSKIVKGKLDLELRPIDLRDTVVAAVDTVRHLAETKAVRLETRLPRESVTVVADETRLIQVLWNLLSNAIKFSASGERVLLTAESAGERLRVAVEDEGEGIPADFLPHVFKPFEQANEHGRRPQGGLGIGLALSRSLVERHGGKIVVESEGPGRGARFTFWIPLHPSADGSQCADFSGAAAGVSVPRYPSAHEAEQGQTVHEAAKGRTAHTAAQAEPAHQGGQAETAHEASQASRLTSAARPVIGLPGRGVLVVEDNPDTLEAMRILLVSWGWKVTGTDNAAGALELLWRHRPDVVISDIGMPRMDGLAFARQVREKEAGKARTLLIAITGFASSADHKRALEAGFDAYLTKPIDFASLREILERVSRFVLEPLEA